MAELAASRPETYFIDIFPTVLRPDGTPDAALFGEDMLRMNPASYARCTAALRPTAEAIQTAA